MNSSPYIRNTRADTNVAPVSLTLGSLHASTPAQYMTSAAHPECHDHRPASGFVGVVPLSTYRDCLVG